MIAMQAGKLRHRMDLYANVGATRNQYGEIASDPQVVARVWVSMEPLRGVELWRAQRIQSEVTHRARMRWRPEVTAKCWLKEGDQTYEILVVLNREERNRELELLCKEAA